MDFLILMTEINFKKHKEKELIFFNDAIEYFDKFDSQDIISDIESYRTEDLEKDPNLLREQMVVELNNLKDIIASNPDLKFKALTEEEKNYFYDFINFYNKCPICGAFNHYYNLKKFYFNENAASLKEECMKFMNLKSNKLQKFNLNFGIPCCNCYKKNFELINED